MPPRSPQAFGRLGFLLLAWAACWPDPVHAEPSKEQVQAFRATADRIRTALRAHPGRSPWFVWPPAPSEDDKTVHCIRFDEVGATYTVHESCEGAARERLSAGIRSDGDYLLIATDASGRRELDWVMLDAPPAEIVEEFNADGTIQSIAVLPAVRAFQAALSLRPGAMIGLVPLEGQLTQITPLARASTAAPTTPCPPRHAIAGTTGSEPLRAYFIGLGFAAGQHAAFRCAADRLVAGLRAHTPLQHRSDLGFYRLEAADPCDLSAPTWDPGQVCASLAAPSEEPEPLHHRVDCVCASSPTHLSDHRTCVYDTLDHCAPDADFVIVVANSEWNTAQGSRNSRYPRATVTLRNIGDEQERWKVLSHELGHAFGLLDESAKASPEHYDAGRNLISACDLVSGDSNLDLPGWEMDCDARMSNQGLSTQCNVQCLDRGGSCLDYGSCQQDDSGCRCSASTSASIVVSADRQPAVGLWQGEPPATAYFQPSNVCGMRAMGSPFCEFCERWLLQHRSVPTGVLSSEPATNPPAAAESANAATPAGSRSGRRQTLTAFLAGHLASEPHARLFATVKVKETWMEIEVERFRFKVPETGERIEILEPREGVERLEIRVGDEPRVFDDPRLALRPGQSLTDVQVRSAITGKPYSARSLFIDVAAPVLAHP